MKKSNIPKRFIIGTIIGSLKRIMDSSDRVDDFIKDSHEVLDVFIRRGLNYREWAYAGKRFVNKHYRFRKYKVERGRMTRLLTIKPGAKSWGQGERAFYIFPMWSSSVDSALCPIAVLRKVLFRDSLFCILLFLCHNSF